MKPAANAIQNFHLSVIPSTSYTPLALSEICPFCLIIYGGVTAMWLLFGLYSKGQNSKEESRKNGVSVAYVSLLSATWASCWVGMLVLNKSLVDCLEAPSLISSIQMAISVIYFGVTSFHQIVNANRREMTRWLIVPVFFAAMRCSSFYSFQYVSLSLLTVVRNLTPLMVLPIEGLVTPADRQLQNTWITKVPALLVMLSGALVYTGGLEEVSMPGVCFAFANVFFAATDRLIQRRLLTTECKSLTSSVCAFVTNGVGIIPAMTLALATREVQGIAKLEHAVTWSDSRVMILLILSGILGIGICYTGCELQRVISVTSFAVMHNASNVAVVACGVLFFRDPIKSTAAKTGLMLSLLGGFFYSHASLQPWTPKAKETVPAQKPVSELDRSAVRKQFPPISEA